MRKGLNQGKCYLPSSEYQVVHLAQFLGVHVSCSFCVGVDTVWSTNQESNVEERFICVHRLPLTQLEAEAQCQVEVATART